tara:strand:- start:1174 stop:1767 length:594 start_codon:yes stop_codon:yes gene_type:complete
VYEDNRGQIRTGDILLFSGKGPLSAGIRRFTQSKWSHVGLAICIPEIDAVLLWESTTMSDVPGVLTGEARQGVQLVALSERIRRYSGEISVRNLTPALDPAQIRTLFAFRKEMRGRPYEQSKIELIKSAYDGWGGQNEEDLSSLFCSELIAEAYQRVGVLTEDVPSNEYTPADFSGKRLIELVHPYRLGPEKPLLQE